MSYDPVKTAGELDVVADRFEAAAKRYLLNAEAAPTETGKTSWLLAAQEYTWNAALLRQAANLIRNTLVVIMASDISAPPN